jgi:transposase
MSKLVAVRLDDGLLAEVDAERRRSRLPRARVVHEALRLWIERRRLDEAVRRDREAYDAQPVHEDEFEPVLGGQRWPR